MARVQVSDNRDSVLHFQVGEAGDYQKFDAPKPKKYSFKGLKTGTSFYGSSTVYHLIPATALKTAASRSAFAKKTGLTVKALKKAADTLESIG